ncbi:MAG: hypothetical protein M9921_08890 [Fimbriimonadaceae bacterium]|nr:hypothetical protein [Chthonomonadaceae bacterium]MCO5296960.1 hypothetical protein [Fimbriimonadaceae bacterium]
MDERKPWDVPVTEEGRDELIRMVADYQQPGDELELGQTLSRLAHVVKHVGSPDGQGAMVRSAQIGSEAVRVLREIDAPKALCRALRIAAVPFVTGIDCEALLAESLTLARQIGDLEEEGWTLFRMTRANGVDGVAVEDALRCFEACGSLSGKACCLVSMAIETQPHPLELLEEAARLYEQDGNEVEAGRARKIAEMLTP